MDSKTKNIFTRINNEDKYFDSIIRKITIEEQLSNNEYSYVLSLSLLFYNEYCENEIMAYLEFSYYLVLYYSLKTEDYNPLLIFSINNGLFPIAKTILLSYNKNIQDAILESEIDYYKKDNIYELKKQYEIRNALIESKSQNRAFVAPTSYGKSSAIIEDIEIQEPDKIGIIVPKKALIWQTFRNIKETAKKRGYKVLLHDSDYNDEEKVICIFTQERALRLIQDSNFYFDVLYIDEAHNLFEKDERNILLARLIKLNKKINPNQKVIYLSPLIRDANDLMLNQDDLIDMHKIDFNIKELRVFFYDDRKRTFEMYNRFVNKFYLRKNDYKGYIDYLNHNLGNKNLFYFYSPKQIENFSIELLESIKKSEFNSLGLLENHKIIEISDMISKYVDKDYNLVELIKYGVVYIHGKMPDSIKDYIINKFITVKELRILISNSSILEGMNLSIDNMFVFDVYKLNENSLINLCGRVNRLSDVFGSKNLSKLFCNIHFLDIALRDIDFRRKISFLRSDVKDDIKNPLLSKAKLDETGRKIARQENEYIANHLNNDTKTILIKNGLSVFYKDINLITNYISIILFDSKIRDLDLISKISTIFLNNQENINDFELKRLIYEETRLFYRMYIDSYYHADLKIKVQFFINYFEKTKNEKFYIGTSFGEIPSSDNPHEKVYVNIKEKNHKERVNLAVIKAKLEDDFISVTLGKFVKTLLDLSLIDEEEYNNFIYGVKDKETLALIKMGVSLTAIKFIKENHLENNFRIKNGSIEIDDIFKSKLEKQDDYIKFEIGKLIC